MAEVKRKYGRGSGPVTLGSVTVPGRWGYHYHEAECCAHPGMPGDDFEFTLKLSIRDRKQLTNLKQGDSMRLTAGPFHELPVRLREVSYEWQRRFGDVQQRRSGLKTRAPSPLSSACRSCRSARPGNWAVHSAHHGLQYPRTCGRVIGSVVAVASSQPFFFPW
jgi:hypothetical protein